MSKETKRLAREAEAEKMLTSKIAEITWCIKTFNHKKADCIAAMRIWQKQAETAKSWRKVNADRMVEAWTAAINENFQNAKV